MPLHMCIYIYIYTYHQFSVFSAAQATKDWVDETEGPGSKEILDDGTLQAHATPAMQADFLGCRLGTRLCLSSVLMEEKGPAKTRILITSTLVVICVFLLVFGGTTQCMLRCLNIRMGEDCQGQQGATSRCLRVAEASCVLWTLRARGVSVMVTG